MKRVEVAENSRVELLLTSEQAARLGIDRDFLWEFGKLERAIQEKVHTAFAKFEQATHAGMHLEKVNNVRDTRLRSIRIDQSWRGIVLAPEDARRPMNTHLLVVVGVGQHHDLAAAGTVDRRFPRNPRLRGGCGFSCQHRPRQAAARGTAARPR